MQQSVGDNIDMFYLPTGLVPFYPVYRLLGPCVRRDFLFTPPVVPPPRIPLVRFPPTPPVTPTSLFSWTPPKAHAHRCLLSCASYSCNLAMNPSAAPRIPRYHFSALCAGVDHSPISISDTRKESSVDLSVAQNPHGPRLRIYSKS